MHWFTERCTVSGKVDDVDHSVDIISDSCAAGVLNVRKVSAVNVNSDKFRFSYSAFTFGTSHSVSMVSTLKCSIKICIDNLDSTCPQDVIKGYATKDTKFSAYQYRDL